MVSTQENRTAATVIGSRPIRHDGIDKVTGRAVYGADVKLPGLVFGHILRSPHAHALIKRLDVTEAERTPGVLAVMTGADMPFAQSRVEDIGEELVNIRFMSDKLMARDKVLYRGHPVAAVAATDLNTAIEAAQRIHVEYDELPPVRNVDEAMAPGAPLLLPDLVGNHLAEKVRHTNVARHFRHEFGSVEAGFAQSSVIVERRFSATTVHQGYIEPQSSTAIWHADGRITIWTSMQGHFSARSQTAGVLRIEESRIRVIPLEIGGGFGGKLGIYLEPIAAILARKSGRPVKVTMDRTSVFEATGPAPAAQIRVKLGADVNGRLLAGEADLRYEAGAYPGSSVGGGAMCVFACYNIPNTRIDGYDVVVNKPKSAAYRAPGAPQSTFATESAVDELCRQLHMDPIEFRLLNAAKEGDRRADGPKLPRIGGAETLQAAKQSSHYQSTLERSGPNGKLRGRGIAMGFWFNGGNRSSVTINVNNDGTVALVEGSVDIGGTRASIAMQAAEVLGLPAEAVRPVVGDTESAGYNDSTAGSRTTYASGAAAVAAAQKIVEEMRLRAAKVWDIPGQNVAFHQGSFTSREDPELQLSFAAVAQATARTGGPVSASATTNMQGGFAGLATHLADVEVDPETGKVDVLRYTAVQDVGRAVHPSYVEGQMQGGAAQGIGWALHEEYYMNGAGALENASFLDYRMPTTLDVPYIDTILVEVPNPNHPYGVRGVGETPIVPPLAAVANALYDALGIRFTTLPMKPSRVLEALLAKSGAG